MTDVAAGLQARPGGAEVEGIGEIVRGPPNALRKASAALRMTVGEDSSRWAGGAAHGVREGRRGGNAERNAGRRW